MKAYIAGPMRGLPEFNFPAFFEAEAVLKDAGWEVVNPARRDVEGGFNYKDLTGKEDLSEQGFDLREALAWDLEQIARHCDAVVVLRGWENSKGANAEVATAKALGLRVLPIGEILKMDTAVVSALDRHVAVELSTLLDAQGEERVVSATGGEKGRKAAELATLDPVALLELAKVSGFGARKYDSFNYLKGYDWTLSANAAFRHLLAFLAGEDNDPESGLPHPAHFAWHGLALTSFLLRGVGTDDRVSAVLGTAPVLKTAP